MARRYDPERRQRIIDAAIRVVRREGIGGLSHRSVAAEADVPLGSTTYHFASLDELLVAALRQTNASFSDTVFRNVRLDDPDRDLAADLARALGQWLAGDRGTNELEYELYLAALRKPVLRPIAQEWVASVTEALARRVDPATAHGVVALMDGVSLQVLLTDREYDEAYARTMLGRLLAGADGAAGAPDGGETGSPADPVAG
ncbi:TetR/AcrR family transcriptional regulator [Streptomyces sp. NPDC017979]|uniref:TetR/AcrR family transcriptional regulator n=1 Tax=Streptomyces sp. NPDC017979 TaxID=3365024 RepID=UPI0037AC57A6